MARASANAFCPRRTHLTTGEPTIPRHPCPRPITAAAVATTLATPAAGTRHLLSRLCQPRPAGTIQTAPREALAAFTLATRVPPTTLQANSIIILLRETTTIRIIIIMTDQLQALPVTGIDGHQRQPYNAIRSCKCSFFIRGGTS